MTKNENLEEHNKTEVKNSSEKDAGSDDEGEDENPDVKQQKKKCPLPHCNSVVRHLPRHLRNVHKWPKQVAKTATSRFKLRKQYTFSSQEAASAGNRKPRKTKCDSKSKNYKKPCRRKKVCPIPGCTTITERLPQHLHQVHKLSSDEPKYKKCMSLAKVVSMKNDHVFHRMKAKRESEMDMDSHMDISSLSKSESSQRDLVNNDPDDPQKSDPNVSGTGDVVRPGSIVDTDEPSSVVQETLQEFEDWLVSPDCEKKDAKTAKQHVAQVKKVLSVIGEGTCLQSLLDRKLVRDVFLRQYAEKKYFPATIKSYLMSLQHFCSFLLGERPSGVEFVKDDVISLREKLKRWSASYKRETTRRRWEKMEEDVSALITPDKVSDFGRSQAVRDAVIILGELSRAHNAEITQAKYTLVRDYLIAQIMIDNANRAGVVAYMTVQEFQRARSEDDRHVVRVLQHKTVDTHGPAQIVLTNHLYNHLNIFLREMRSKLPVNVCAEGNDKFFLSWGGNSMESSQMSRALSSIFQKAGMEGPVTHTLYRKSAVSECHQNRKDISGNLADLMAHREATAEKYYRVLDKSKSSVKASQILHGMMRNPRKSEGRSNKNEIEEPDPTVEEAEIENEKAEEGGIKELALSSKEVQEKEESLPIASPTSEEKANAIKELFRSEITEQKISMASVREKIKSHPILVKEDAKKVYDKVRAQWRFNSQETRTGTVDLPSQKDTVTNRVSRMFNTSGDGEDSDHSSDILSPTVTTTKSKPGLFSATHVETMIRLFPDMIKGSPISKPVIAKRLQNDSQGIKLFAEFTVEQVVNRLKYERKHRKPGMKIR